MVDGAEPILSWSRPSYTCSGFDERENGSGPSHIETSTGSRCAVGRWYHTILHCRSGDACELTTGEPYDRSVSCTSQADIALDLISCIGMSVNLVHMLRCLCDARQKEMAQMLTEKMSSCDKRRQFEPRQRVNQPSSYRNRRRRPADNVRSEQCCQLLPEGCEERTSGQHVERHRLDSPANSDGSGMATGV
jgi:hypothetical protein